MVIDSDVNPHGHSAVPLTTAAPLRASVRLLPGQLRRCMPHAREQDLLKFEDPLIAACAEFGIDTPRRLAAFVAQVAHESGSLRYAEELASGDAYEGRKDLGNVQPGDGKRFKGRGLIQLTGRANYTRASGKLGVDLVANPKRAGSDPALSARIAALFFAENCLRAADAGDIVKVSRIVNGGTNGLADRQAYYKRACAVFGT